MECNRDEALRAKEVAESKFKEKDIVGAKKFAMKAQNLFPLLEGIDQMIATLDIYQAAEVKLKGESDWYAILSVNTSADDESLKKNYRRLALQLHPDKNKSIGAEGAFKLLSEAWSVLSDKTRKMAYDRSRNINGYHNNSTQIHSSANGFYEFSQTTKSSKKSRKSNTTSTQSAASTSLNTFWTSCNRCRMQYEYLRIYVNHNLLCPNCQQAFPAVEIGVPATVVNSPGSWSATQHHQSTNHCTTKNGHCSSFTTSTFPGTGGMELQHGGDFNCYSTNLQWGPNLGVHGTSVTNDPSLKAANKIQRKLEKLRRKEEKAQAAARTAEALGNNYNATNSNVYNYGNLDFSRNGYAFEQKHHISRPGRPPKRKADSIDDNFFDRGGDEARKFTISAASEVTRTNNSFTDYSRTRMPSRQNSFNTEISQINTRQLLMEKVKLSICERLGEWNLQKQENLRLLQKTNQGLNGKDNCSEYIKDKVDWEKNRDTQVDNPKMKNSSNCLMEIRKTLSIDVPDPDFCDFDKDRLEKSFESDQVWATYDNEDGMPRFYAYIQKVLSLKPFKVRMSFLTSKSNSEFGSMNWIASGFAKTCGNFRVSRYEITDTINIFSHKVGWEKGPRGSFKIVPKKGDTWALYRNWSPDWNELTADDVIHKYEMIEVVDDYDDEHGVNVTPLVKVAGFKAVFHRHLDPKEIRRIALEEMFRFSHQVPSYLLTGDEAHNALKGCRELDPAATPLDLLQVITELKDDADLETNNQQVDS